MKNVDLQVDAYIARAAGFARPILRKIRALFHKACPDLEEKLKWGCPSFEYRGLMGGMAAFKRHAGFGLWRHRELPDPHGLFRSRSPWGAGTLTDVSQLPPDAVLLSYIRAAVKLNEKGPAARPKRTPKPPVRVPDDVRAALRKNRKARATFEAFSPSHRREYVEWIVEARREETRNRRLKTAVAWMARGSSRHWRYARK